MAVFRALRAVLVRTQTIGVPASLKLPPSQHTAWWKRGGRCLLRRRVCTTNCLTCHRFAHVAHPEQVNAAASIIQRHVHPDANIIIGALVDERCGKQVSVTVLATGFGVSQSRAFLCLVARVYVLPLCQLFVRNDLVAGKEACV